ncbi:MAG: Rossmann-like and DUF2520 domain-containing protein [Pyrinomonadaceae bacterium]
MVSVTIIGPGRVGGALAVSLPPDKYTVEKLVFRGDSDLSAVTRVLAPQPELIRLEDLKEIGTDVIFITTQDAWIGPVARELASKITGDAIVFHTSGSYPSSVLDELKDVGCETGSLHPLVSISLPELGPTRFPNAFFCVEGTPKAVETGEAIAVALGGRPFSIDTKYKTLYHAAAVTACGHLVALFDSAVEMMTKCGLSAENSKDILMPLVTSTVKNLSEQSTPAALTGTFARADIETFTRHLTALNENVSDDLLEIYLLLGERSLELAAKQGVNADRIDKLRTKVSIAKSKLKW